MPRLIERPLLRRHLRRLVEHGELSEPERDTVRAVIRNLGTLNFIQDKIEAAALKDQAEKRFHPNNVRQWLWHRRILDLAEMERLASAFA